MEQILPSKVEAVLLFDEYVGFDPKQLLGLLNQVGSQYSEQFRWTPSEAIEAQIEFTGENLSIQIVHGQTPLAQEGFVDALASGYTGMMFPQAREAIDMHRKHVYLSVGAGGEKNSHEHGGAGGANSATLKPSDFDVAAAILKSLIMIYVSRSRPLAIHWLQCNKLLQVRQFAELALEANDISLLVHPSIYSTGADDDGRTLTGFRTYGAKNLIGKEIHFEECVVEASRLFERCMQFILKVREIGLMIPDGDSFGMDESEVIRVRHVEDDNDPDGIIQLDYERCDDFGINKLADEGESEEAGDEIDLDNPVQRALQEKINQLKSQEQQQYSSTESAADEEDGDAGPAVEPWQGTTRRADISALRALAKAANEQAGYVNAPADVEKPAADDIMMDEGKGEAVAVSEPSVSQAEELDDAKSGGLFKKVSGLFSRK